MEQLADECMEYFYNVMLALGDTGLDRLSRGGPYLHLLPDQTASLCNNLTLTFVSMICCFLFFSLFILIFNILLFFFSCPYTI